MIKAILNNGSYQAVADGQVIQPTVSHQGANTVLQVSSVPTAIRVYTSSGDHRLSSHTHTQCVDTHITLSPYFLLDLK